LFIWNVEGRKVLESRVFYDFGTSTDYIFNIIAERRDAIAKEAGVTL
jgi:hypothetical protein